MLKLEIPMEVFNLVEELAAQRCEVRFYHAPTQRTQPCSSVNPCIPCRARVAQNQISSMFRNRSKR